MPQPLSKICPGANWSWSTHAIDQVPALAPHICKIFSSWAAVEYSLEMLFLSVTRGSSRSALAVFDSLESERAKFGAIRAAARVHLQQSDVIALEAVLAMVKSAGKLRNRFAHHLWGTVEQVPDRLLLTPPDVASRIWRETKITLFAIKYLKRNDRDTQKLSQEETSRVMVYDLAEIEQIILDLNEAIRALYLFQALLDARDGAQDGPPLPKRKGGFPGSVFYAIRQLLLIRRFRETRHQMRDKLRRRGHL